MVSSWVASSAARTIETRDAALGRVFGPDARFEPRTVYLTTAQADSVQALAGGALRNAAIHLLASASR